MEATTTGTTKPKKNSGEPPKPSIDEDALSGGPSVGRQPFPDLEAALGLGDDGINVKELLVSIACRKPRPTEYFSVDPRPEMARPAYVFIDRDEIGGETYFVLPPVRPLIAEHLRPVLLVSCVNRQGVPYLWPITLPDPGVNSGRQNRWGASALEAMEAAKSKWVKLVAGSGAYRVFVAENSSLPAPQFTDKSFLELLQIAFKDTIIADEEHPVIKRLRGRV
jgi:hypothetical protein